MLQPAPSRPRCFRQSRLLIVGCGDVGERVLKVLNGRLRVRVLSRTAARDPALRALGATPVRGDLDHAASLTRLAGLAPRLLHLAPPPGTGADDPRTTALVQALARRGGIVQAVYGSTTGVYGDAGGAVFDETRAVAPASDRARRRVAAEACLRAWGQGGGPRVTVLRIPGIYAPDRPGGDPRERLQRGTPSLQAPDDVYTNHIHADDLARACLLALWRGRPQRVVHVCDHTDMKMGDYFDAVADLCGLPRPPRVSRADASQHFSAMQMSFLSESRRLLNHRLQRELRLRLRYPTFRQGLAPAG